MKKPKKPTLKKMPKKPKMTGTKASWDKFEAKAKEVKGENDKKMKAYESEVKKYDAEQKRRLALKSKF